MAEQGNIPLPDFVEEPFQIRDGVLWRCLNVVPHGLRWEPVGNVAELIERCSRAETERDELKQQLYDEALAFNHANEIVAKLETDNAALRARCERLEKPVTQEEKSRVGGMWLREEVDALLAARKGE